jgi:hypothetical protein
MAQAGVVRIYRPRALVGDAGYFRVVIDGVEAGELWANQVRVFQIAPGDHRLWLKQYFFRSSQRLNFFVASGQEVDFTCSQLAAFGLFGLHEATPKQRLKMQELDKRRQDRPPPRDFGTAGRQHL